MMVLVGKSPVTIARDHRHPNVGILSSPTHPARAHQAAAAGFRWAADNDCFNDGFDNVAYVRMLRRSVGAAGCLFVAAPDVVGEAMATLDLFERWGPFVRELGFPVALVAQDGMTVEDVEWWAGAYDALFIGGTTEWKMSDDAHSLVRACPEWVHMGRVNTARRLELAKAWGVDSVDGTSTARFTDTHLPWQLDQAAGATQQPLDWWREGER